MCGVRIQLSDEGPSPPERRRVPEWIATHIHTAENTWRVRAPIPPPLRA
jgi:hypothetical protein